MPDTAHRLPHHLHRHGLTYAVAAVALSLSPLPSVAADLVTTADIADGAVTQPKLAASSVTSSKVVDGGILSADIRDGTVGTADLAESARGAKVIRYDIGRHDFSIGSSGAQLPGTWSRAVVANSTWSAVLYSSDSTFAYAVPGRGLDGQTEYRVTVTNDGVVTIDPVIGPGETYTSVQVFRTVARSTVTIAQ